MRRVVALGLIGVVVPLAKPAPAMAQGGGAGCATATTGCIAGNAADQAKNPLANHTVRIRNLANNQIVSTTQSAGNGSFTAAGLNPGNYVVEIVGPGNAGVIATSSTITVAAGSTAAVTITATALTGLMGAAGGGGLAGLFSGTSLVVVTAAGLAGVVIAVEATQDDASPSR